MNKPRRPHLPEAAPTPPPEKPHPLLRPDERKEGGPDYGKADRQQENRRQTEDEAREEAKD